MATFLLIHGGAHTGRCWHAVVHRLVAAGHRALAPDLPGMGTDRTPPQDVSLEMTGRFVADLARRQSGKTIVVGHSLGGLAISEAAEAAPEAIAGLVYVAAVLLPGGEAWMGKLMRDGELPERLSLSEDGATLTVDPLLARELFYSGCDAADVQYALECLVPQPTRPMRDRLTVSSGRFGMVPRAYVETVHDKAFPLEIQRSQQAALPCRPVFTMHTGHSPFLQAPQELTAHLLAAASAFLAPPNAALAR
jgi:pimeloyl-ACP methyl ester carboxylesterase